MNKIVIIGGGGHAKVVLEAVRGSVTLEVIGIVDSKLKRGSLVEGIRVLGGDEELPRIYSEGCRLAFIAVGSVGDSSTRRGIEEKTKAVGFKLGTIVHPDAVVAQSVQIGPGAFVAAGAVIQPGVKIGENVIINTRASVDHDCVIGKFCHIAPGVVLSGGVVVEEDAHIGTGSSVTENRRIGRAALIGAGSVVVSDIPARSKAFGNPCRVQEVVT